MEINNNELKSTDLAYWIGVAQTDGYFKKQLIKKHRIYRYLIRLTVGYCSLPMLEKFKTLSRNIFGVKGTTWHNEKGSSVDFQFGAKNLLTIFEKYQIDFSDPPKPPYWITESKFYFGAYLAGVIDGDGSVTIKRPAYPQCSVRIHSGSPAINLADEIKKQMGIVTSLSSRCQTSFLNGRKIVGINHILEFYLSSKNFDYFDKFVVSHMALPHKRSKIEKYLLMR